MRGRFFGCFVVEAVLGGLCGLTCAFTLQPGEIVLVVVVLVVVFFLDARCRARRVRIVRVACVRRCGCRGEVVAVGLATFVAVFKG